MRNLCIHKICTYINSISKRTKVTYGLQEMMSQGRHHTDRDQDIVRVLAVSPLLTEAQLYADLGLLDLSVQVASHGTHELDHVEQLHWFVSRDFQRLFTRQRWWVIYNTPAHMIREGESYMSKTSKRNILNNVKDNILKTWLMCLIARLYYIALSLQEKDNGGPSHENHTKRFVLSNWLTKTHY